MNFCLAIPTIKSMMTMREVLEATFPVDWMKWNSVLSTKIKPFLISKIRMSLSKKVKIKMMRTKKSSELTNNSDTSSPPSMVPAIIAMIAPKTQCQ